VSSQSIRGSGGQARRNRVARLLELAARITQRDREVCRIVFDHRVLTTVQVADLGFPTDHKAQERLSILLRLEVVDRFRSCGNPWPGRSDQWMSETFNLGQRWLATVTIMKLHPALIELVVSDMGATLAFYRRLGLDIPKTADAEPHVDVELAGGIRLAWDTEDTIRSFDPGWSPPTGGGHRANLAFACGSPAEVDAAWTELTEAGYEGHLEPWDAFWGMRYAVVHDPDGRPVDLFALLPSA
jgi:catechol 2,3-dioxygenase-like lactoylglutathione lyase family enzyme